MSSEVFIDLTKVKERNMPPPSNNLDAVIIELLDSSDDDDDCGPHEPACTASNRRSSRNAPPQPEVAPLKSQPSLPGQRKGGPEGSDWAPLGHGTPRRGLGGVRQPEGSGRGVRDTLEGSRRTPRANLQRSALDPGGSGETPGQSRQDPRLRSGGLSRDKGSGASSERGLEGGSNGSPAEKNTAEGVGGPRTPGETEGRRNSARTSPTAPALASAAEPEATGPLPRSRDAARLPSAPTAAADDGPPDPTAGAVTGTRSSAPLPPGARERRGASAAVASDGDGMAGTPGRKDAAARGPAVPGSSPPDPPQSAPVAGGDVGGELEAGVNDSQARPAPRRSLRRLRDNGGSEGEGELEPPRSVPRGSLEQRSPSSRVAGRDAAGASGSAMQGYSGREYEYLPSG